ncbi:MAG: HAD family hydrolase [Coriobacteriales bacterium]|jgi:pyrophosphatase PpaX
MNALKAVLFDNDGTLVDTYDLLLASFRYATREVLGHELPEEVLMAKVGTPLADQMKDFTDDPVLQKQLLDTYRSYNHRVHDERVSVFSGELNALDRLQDAGFAMGVVTSKMHRLTQHGLDVLGLDRYFTVLMGADDSEKHKPDPEPVVLGCERLGVAPEDCAYVGDSPFDMAAGKAAGCFTVGVTWGMFPRARLEEQGADAIVESYGELADLLIARAK